MSSTPELRPWGEKEKLNWFARQKVRRSYEDDVVAKLKRLPSDVFTVEQYGALTIDPEKYPLFAVTVGQWDNSRPNVLITGSVHGYETSGCSGAVQFLESGEASDYSRYFNILVAPCVSPWGYETINRWNPYTENPNREFKPGGKAEESVFLMQHVWSKRFVDDLRIDLHETTDTDKTQFRREQAEKDGKPYDETKEIIPDGFYLVGTEGVPNPALEKAIIDSVRKVTHIAQPDLNGKIIGVPVRQEGVIDYPGSLGLSADFTGAAVYRLGAVTTEIYPDSKGMTNAICNAGQMAAIKGALDHVLANPNLIR